MATLALAGLTALAGCQFDALTRAESERIDAFDFYWQALADDYPLFGKQQVDWNELRQRYRGAVPFARAPHEFYHLLTGMLSELSDPHVSLSVPPDRLVVDGREPTSLLDVAGLRLMPIEGRIHVVQWPAQQEPQRPEGLPESASPELWRVEGFPVVLSLVGNLLLGPPDSRVELQLRWRNGVVTRHLMTRPKVGTPHRGNAFGHLDAAGMTWLTRAHGPFPWLAVHTLDDELDIARIDQVIDAARDSEAFVLDLRANLGGRWLRAQQLVERFLPEPIELVLVPSHPTSSWLGLFDIEMFVRSEWQPRPPIYAHPIVVVTSALTGSAAEHATRVLQRYAGAKVVGERTAGAEAAIQEAIGPDGGRVRFGSTRIVDRTGVGLQADGEVPDFSVRLTLDDVERLGPDGAVSDWERRLRAATVRAVRGAR